MWNSRYDRQLRSQANRSTSLVGDGSQRTSSRRSSAWIVSVCDETDHQAVVLFLRGHTLNLKPCVFDRSRPCSRLRVKVARLWCAWRSAVVARSYLRQSLLHCLQTRYAVHLKTGRKSWRVFALSLLHVGHHQRNIVIKPQQNCGPSKILCQCSAVPVGQYNPPATSLSSVDCLCCTYYRICTNPLRGSCFGPGIYALVHVGIISFGDQLSRTNQMVKTVRKSWNKI